MTIDQLQRTKQPRAGTAFRPDEKDTAMCDGEGLGLIQMAMTPIGLAVTAAAAGALFLFARWVLAN
jgi:hypothetical protein